MISLKKIIQEYNDELCIFEIKLNIRLCEKIIGKYAVCKQTEDIDSAGIPSEQKGIITSATMMDIGIIKIKIDNSDYEWWHGIWGHSIKIYNRKPNV